MSQDTLYLLSNAFYGLQSALQVDQTSNYRTLIDGTATSNETLFWTITPSAGNSSWYNICTTYQNTPYCLDILNIDNGATRTTPRLASRGQYPGQQWNIISEADSYHKLSNDWTGPGWYLDTYSVTRTAFMSQDNFQGQYWLLNPIQGQSAFTSSLSSSITSSIPTASAPASSMTSSNIAVSTSATTGASVAVPASTSDSSSGSSSSSNTGAIAGGVVGGVIALAALVSAVFWTLRRRRKSKESQGDLPVAETKQEPQELHGSNQLVEVGGGQVFELGDGIIVPEVAGDSPTTHNKPVRYA